MKKFYFASPSFLLSVFFFIIFSSSAHPQEKKVDSTTYHYNAILSPKNNYTIQKSIVFFKTQLEEHNTNDDPIYRAQILNIIALGQYNMGELFKSETTAVDSYKALELAPKTSERNAIQVSLGNHLGRLYKRVGDTNNALDYFTKTLHLVTKKSDSIIILNNIASIHIDSGEYQKAIDILKPFVNDSTGIEENINRATVLDNYGYSLARLHNSEGVAFLKRAEEINEKIKHSRGLFSTQRHLAEHYKLNGEITKASVYSANAIKIANELKAPYFRLKALGIAIETGDTSGALVYKKLSDSLKSVEQQEENKYIAQKYEYSQYQTAAKENELIAQKEITKNRLYQLLVITLLLLITAVIIISKILGRKKRMEQLFETEARFSKKIHDEVSNDVYKVMAQIQSNKGIDPRLIDNLESIYNRTRDISRENSLIDVATCFHSTLTDLFLGYQSDTLQIITRNSEALQWKRISKTKKNTIYRVLQELITNTIKHGQASLILIEFAQKRKQITLTYTDNGVGGALSSKNGLQNVENRIIAHKGTITFESEKNKGFKAHIQI